MSLNNILGKNRTKKLEKSYTSLQNKGLGSYEDINKASEGLAYSGIAYKDLGKATEAILKFSKVAKMDLGSSLDVIASVSQYTNKSVADLTDIISNVQTKLKVNKLDEFSNSLKNVSYSAKQAKLSAEDMASVLGYFSTKMTTGEAENGLKEILNKVPAVIKELNITGVFKKDGSLDFIKFLTEVREKTKSLKDVSLERVFSKEGLWIIKETTKNSGSLQKAIDSVTKSYKGQLDLKYKDYADTYNNATLRLTEASKNFAAILGNNILPKITSFKNKLADIIFAFNDFIQKHKWAADAVVKLSEVLTALLAGLAVYRVLAFANSILGLATAFEFVRTAIVATSIAARFLTGAILTNPILAVIAGIATGAYLIISNWETLKSWFVSFFKWFENTAVFKFFKNGIEKVKDLFGKGSDIVVDNTTIQKAKENGNPSGNQKIVHNRQSYSVVVNSNTGNPKDIGEEVVHKLATGMVG